MSKNDFKIFNFLVLCIILLGLATAVQEVEIRFVRIQEEKKVEPPAKLTYIPQFVLISFDGSGAVPIWRDLREFKDQLKQEGKKVNFTHFINTSYFLTKDTRNFYPYRIDLGVGDTLDTIRERILEINLALADGDEIAPHTTGHRSGRGWTSEEWKSELSTFDAILFGLDQLYPDGSLPKLNLARTDMIGFRAPYLDVSTGLYDALHELGFKYDTSEIGPTDVWPKKDEKGMWHIPLGTLFVGPNRVPILAMDYNLYMRHSDARDVLKKGTPAWQSAHDEMLTAWRDYFTRNYTKDRAPVLVGYHFGSWNDGLYWEVMKEFTREVCGQPDVHCGTFKDLVKYMEEYGVPQK
jgi:hypothetical protein